MNAALASIAYPKRLELHNRVLVDVFSMRLKDVVEIEGDVLIKNAPGAHKLLDYTTQSGVCDAIAVLGLTVEILEPRSKAYLGRCKEAKVSLTLDREDVLLNEPLKNCAPFQGKEFLRPSPLYEATLPKGDRVGIFISNGTVVGAVISGLAKTKGPVKLRISLDTAVYTTKL